MQSSGSVWLSEFLVEGILEKLLQLTDGCGQRAVSLKAFPTLTLMPSLLHIGGLGHRRSLMGFEVSCVLALSPDEVLHMEEGSRLWMQYSTLMIVLEFKVWARHSPSPPDTQSHLCVTEPKASAAGNGRTRPYQRERELYKEKQIWTNSKGHVINIAKRDTSQQVYT